MPANFLNDRLANNNSAKSVSSEPIIWANPNAKGPSGGSKDNSEINSVWLLTYPILKS